MGQRLDEFPRIFISYRRADGSGYAGRIYDKLSSQFGIDQMFLDVGHIEAGTNFVRVLQDRINWCDAMLAVISESWLGAKDSEGRPRIHSPDDLVRMEIDLAMERQILVIPVLVGNARMPSEAELPSQLSTFSRLHAVTLPDSSFHRELTHQLVPVLERIGKERAAREQEEAKKGAENSHRAWVASKEALDHLTIPEALFLLSRDNFFDEDLVSAAALAELLFAKRVSVNVAGGGFIATVNTAIPVGDKIIDFALDRLVAMRSEANGISDSVNLGTDWTLGRLTDKKIAIDHLVEKGILGATTTPFWLFWTEDVYFVLDRTKQTKLLGWFEDHIRTSTPLSHREAALAAIISLSRAEDTPVPNEIQGAAGVISEKNDVGVLLKRLIKEIREEKERGRRKAAESAGDWSGAG